MTLSLHARPTTIYSVYAARRGREINYIWISNGRRHRRAHCSSDAATVVRHPLAEWKLRISESSARVLMSGHIFFSVTAAAAFAFTLIFFFFNYTRAHTKISPERKFLSSFHPLHHTPHSLTAPPPPVTIVRCVYLLYMYIHFPPRCLKKKKTTRPANYVCRRHCHYIQYTHIYV